MKATSVASRRHLAGTPKPRMLDVFARRLVLGKLEQLKVGRIVVEDGVHSWSFGEAEDLRVKAQAMLKAGRFAAARELSRGARRALIDPTGCAMPNTTAGIADSCRHPRQDHTSAGPCTAVCGSRNG